MTDARLLLCFLVLLAWRPPQADADLPKLQVSKNGRFLVTAKGEPFFYLGDTAWELFHRLDREDADRYLSEAGEAGLHRHPGGGARRVRRPHRPQRLRPPAARRPRPGPARLKEGPSTTTGTTSITSSTGERPRPVRRLPADLGPVLARQGRRRQAAVHRENAEVYGEWLGKRYKDKGLIWILGGDRPMDNDEQKEIIRAMARGLARGDGGSHLMTFHPPGGAGSAEWFHADDWLDFNMRQNGHGAEFTGRYDKTRADYDRKPTKPVIDGEPIYEGHPIAFNAQKFGHSIAADVRRPLYWDLFSGAFGHTYGHHSVWAIGRRAGHPSTPRSCRGPRRWTQPGANRWSTPGGCSSRGRS